MGRASSKISGTVKSLFKYFSNKLYDLCAGAKRRCKGPGRSAGGLKAQKRRDVIFYALWTVIPFLLFAFQHAVINGNSLILSFKRYTDDGSTVFNGLENFKAVIGDFISSSELQAALKRSVTVYLTLILTSTALPVFFSYYIYKKKPGYRIFKVLLFIPTIISSMITVIIFRFAVDRLVPMMYFKFAERIIEGLLSNPTTTYNTIFFYCLWMSFGSGLLIQLAAMNTTDESCTESARIDGIGFLQELWYIVLPASYRIISLNFIMGFATLFTHDLGLYAFFGMHADIRHVTVGYYFTTKTYLAEAWQYPYFAAWGLITSVIAIPVTLLLRYLLYKYGPSEE